MYNGTKLNKYYFTLFLQYDKLIMEKESMQKMAKIQDEMHLVKNNFICGMLP